MAMSSKAKTICDLIHAQFNETRINGMRYGINDNGMYFTIVEFPVWNCLIVGYSNSEDHARRGLAEDGDQFFLDDKEDDLVESIKQEILHAEHDDFYDYFDN